MRSHSGRPETEETEEDIHEKMKLERTIEAPRKENDIMRGMLRELQEHNAVLEKKNNGEADWSAQKKWGESPMDSESKKQRIEQEEGNRW